MASRILRGGKPIVSPNFYDFAGRDFTASLWIHLDSLLRMVLTRSADEYRPNATWKRNLVLIREVVVAKDAIDVDATVRKDLVLKSRHVIIG